MSSDSLGKAVLAALGFAVFCYVGDYFGFLPQSMKDTAAWFRENTALFLVFLGFCVACLTVIKIKGVAKRDN
jgi:hypothetical protein